MGANSGGLYCGGSIMSLTNCELCGRVMTAAESSTGGFLKAYCGCDRTRTKNRALNPDATGRLPDDAPLSKIGMCLQAAVRPIAVPLLFVIYCAAGVPLFGRQLCHVAVMCCDTLFDKVANAAGWDTRYWPFPKASDQSLPGKKNVQE